MFEMFALRVLFFFFEKKEEKKGKWDSYGLVEYYFFFNFIL